jgi:hypothetical protein
MLLLPGLGSTSINKLLIKIQMPLAEAFVDVCHITIQIFPDNYHVSASVPHWKETEITPKPPSRHNRNNLIIISGIKYLTSPFASLPV